MYLIQLLAIIIIMMCLAWEHTHSKNFTLQYLKNEKQHIKNKNKNKKLKIWRL